MLSRRQLFLLITLIFSFISVFVPFYPLPPVWAVGLVLAAAAFLATNWALRDLVFLEKIVFSIYPILLGLSVLVVVTTFDLTFNLPMWQAGAVLVFFWIIAYALLLSLNIINVATVRTVPLRKVALSFTYYLGIILGFLFFLALLKAYSLNYIYLTAGVFAVSILLSLPNFYFSQVSGITGEFLNLELRPRPKIYMAELLVLAFIMAQTAIAVVFLPAQIFLKAIFMSGTLFVLANFFQNIIQKKADKKIVYEFLLVWLVLFLALVAGRG